MSDTHVCDVCTENPFVLPKISTKTYIERLNHRENGYKNFILSYSNSHAF